MYTLILSKTVVGHFPERRKLFGQGVGKVYFTGESVHFLSVNCPGVGHFPERGAMVGLAGVVVSDAHEIPHARNLVGLLVWHRLADFHQPEQTPKNARNTECPSKLARQGAFTDLRASRANPRF